MTGPGRFANPYLCRFSATIIRLLRRTAASRIIDAKSPLLPSFRGILGLTVLLILAVGIPRPAQAFAPSFRDAAVATTGSATSITISRPLALVDDVMIAVVTTLSPAGGLTVTPPAGWTHIRQDITAGELAQDLFYRVATGGEPINYTFTLNQSLVSAGAIAAYWQVDTAAPIDAHGGQYNPGTPPAAPSITTTVGDTLLVSVFGTKNGDSVNPPGGMIERWRSEGTNGHQGYDQVFSGTGATGARTSSSNESPTIGQLLALRPATTAPPGSAGTVLFVTRNTDETLTPFEQLRADQMISWGYAINTIAENADPGIYALRVPQADVVYLPADVQSNTHGTRTRDACSGVLNEERFLYDELGIASSGTSTTDTDTRIVDTSHYITQPFMIGDYPLFSTSQNLNYLSGTVAPGATILAAQPAAGLVGNLTVIDTGGTLSDGGTAAARRVQLPWGNSSTDFTEITASSLQLMKRSLEWAAQNGSCYNLQKRSFLTDGTPLPDGTQLPAGTEVKFLIYINNKGGALADISIRDVLDPAFSYRLDTLQIDNSQPACSGTTCSAAEESSIFSAVSGTAFLSDSPVGDGASLSGTDTITVGSRPVIGNGTVNVAANSVFALLFSVTLN